MNLVLKINKPIFKKFETINSFEQFFLAEIYNWDDGTEVLNWIINSNKCDKGTASLIFWRSAPDFYLDGDNKITDYEEETYDLLKLIIEKFKNNKFKSAKIKYNPENDFDIENYSENIKKWNLPSEMTKQTNGIKPIYLGTFLNFLKNKYKKSQKKKSKRRKK